MLKRKRPDEAFYVNVTIADQRAMATTGRLKDTRFLFPVVYSNTVGDLVEGVKQIYNGYIEDDVVILKVSESPPFQSTQLKREDIVGDVLEPNSSLEIRSVSQNEISDNEETYLNTVWLQTETGKVVCVAYTEEKE